MISFWEALIRGLSLKRKEKKKGKFTYDPTGSHPKFKPEAYKGLMKSLPIFSS